MFQLLAIIFLPHSGFPERLLGGWDKLFPLPSFVSKWSKAAFLPPGYKRKHIKLNMKIWSREYLHKLYELSTGIRIRTESASFSYPTPYISLTQTSPRAPSVPVRWFDGLGSGSLKYVLYKRNKHTAHYASRRALFVSSCLHLSSHNERTPTRVATADEAQAMCDSSITTARARAPVCFFCDVRAPWKGHSIRIMKENED